jgi:DegV family protein with EDD domain
VRIVTNPGINLDAAEIARYRPFLMPQAIVVDGVEHDTRDGISHADIDAWVNKAKEHPYVLGTSAARFVDAFRTLAQDHEELLVVQGSRNIIGSYASAVSAVRTLEKLPGLGGVRAKIVDTRLTDLGAGLSVIFAAEADRAGLPFARIVELCEQLARHAVGVFVPRELDYLVKGGRASFMKAMIANLLGRSPVIVMEEGELRPAGTTRREEMIPSMCSELVKRVGRGRRVWLALVHGGEDPGAAHLVAALRKELDVALCLCRPASAAVYLNMGPGSLAAFALPVDRIDWRPPALPSGL